MQLPDIEAVGVGLHPAGWIGVIRIAGGLAISISRMGKADDVGYNGRALDLWATVEALLVELEQAGWGCKS